MSESTLDKLAAIRELQGREPIDGSKIEGFGPGAPPAPQAWSPPTSTNDLPEDPDEYEEAERPLTAAEGLASSQSPLVRAAKPEKPKPPPQIPLPQMPTPDLAILDSEAAFLGRTVSLNDSEQKQVRTIILKAFQRDLRDQMSALKSLTPRRGRRAKPADPVASGEPVKRKRGRPRGSLLK